MFTIAVLTIIGERLPEHELVLGVAGRYSRPHHVLPASCRCFLEQLNKTTTGYSAHLRPRCERECTRGLEQVAYIGMEWNSFHLPLFLKVGAFLVRSESMSDIW